MTEIIMVGCNGRMGQVISNLVAQDENAKIVAGVDVFDDGRNPYPVFKNLEECTVAADAVIDFSSPKSLEVLLRVSKKTKSSFSTMYNRLHRGGS